MSEMKSEVMPETAQEDKETLIRTDDLWKTYEMGNTAVHALQGVSFSIHRNEYVDTLA